MRELQAAFESPPRVRMFVIGWQLVTHEDDSQYGKNLDWKKENYTTHDVASVFRRYLTQMPVRNTRQLYLPIAEHRSGTCYTPRYVSLCECWETHLCIRDADRLGGTSSEMHWVRDTALGKLVIPDPYSSEKAVQPG